MHVFGMSRTVATSLVNNSPVKSHYIHFCPESLGALFENLKDNTNPTGQSASRTMIDCTHWPIGDQLKPVSDWRLELFCLHRLAEGVLCQLLLPPSFRTRQIRHMLAGARLFGRNEWKCDFKVGVVYRAMCLQLMM